MDATGQSREVVQEPLHRKRISCSFAIAAKEVTLEQFLRFRPTHRYSPRPEVPIMGAMWYDAAAYCNWLSEQEGIPEAEWCYPKQWSRLPRGEHFAAEQRVLPGRNSEAIFSPECAEMPSPGRCPVSSCPLTPSPLPRGGEGKG